MAAKVTFDTANKLIIGSQAPVGGKVDCDVRVDLYSDAKEDWLTDANLQKFRFPFAFPEGGADTGDGVKSPLYLFIRYGWRFRPYEGDHIWTFKEGAIVVGEDATADPFVSTVGAYNVRTRFEVPVRGTLLETGVSGLTSQESQALLDIDSNVAQNTADLSSIAADISTITGDIALIRGDITSIEGNISVIQLDLSNIAASVVTINTNIGTITAAISNIETALALIEAIERGEWKIENNQMIFYNLASAEVARFNLFDKFGAPASEDIYRRVPV